MNIVKKLLCCCSIAAGLLVMAQAPSWSACDSWCSSTIITCKTGYTCNKCVQGTQGVCGNVSSHCAAVGETGGACRATSCLTGEIQKGTCSNGYKACCTSTAMAKTDSAKTGTLANRAPASKPSSWVAKLLDTIAAPAHATNCWSGGNNFGFRNNSSQTDFNGTTRQCEAKLHVCFANGSVDAAIPCTVNTTGGCDNACTNVSDIACNTTDVNGLTFCQSRCYAARVNGYSDTCD